MWTRRASSARNPTPFTSELLTGSWRPPFAERPVVAPCRARHFRPVAPTGRRPACIPEFPSDADLTRVVGCPDLREPVGRAVLALIDKAGSPLGRKMLGCRPSRRTPRTPGRFTPHGRMRPAASAQAAFGKTVPGRRAGSSRSRRTVVQWFACSVAPERVQEVTSAPSYRPLGAGSSQSSWVEPRGHS
jgi:hypothetical protein